MFISINKTMFQYMKQFEKTLASFVDTAAKNVKAIPQLSNEHDFDITTAYRIQALSVEQRLMRSEQLSGFKLGFTSKAKMNQMGLNEVIWGRLTDKMAIKNGGVLVRENFIHPRAEPEIAYKLAKSINKLLSLEEAKAYIEAVAPAMEVIDSRYENFKFSLADVIADNCSSAGYIIGEWHQANKQVNHVEIDLMINDEIVEKGNTNAILGDPMASVVELSKMAEKYNITVSAGDIVLAGAATSAHYIHSGDVVKASFKSMGQVTFTVT